MRILLAARFLANNPLPNMVFRRRRELIVYDVVVPSFYHAHDSVSTVVAILDFGWYKKYCVACYCCWDVQVDVDLHLWGLMNFGGRWEMMILLMVIAVILLFVVVVLWNFDCYFAGIYPVVPHDPSCLCRYCCDSFGTTMRRRILEPVVVAFVVVLFSNVDYSFAVIHHLIVVVVVESPPLSQQTLEQN
jgi:hypothetical protein